MQLIELKLTVDGVLGIRSGSGFHFRQQLFQIQDPDFIFGSNFFKFKLRKIQIQKLLK